MLKNVIVIALIKKYTFIFSSENKLAFFSVQPCPLACSLAHMPTGTLGNVFSSLSHLPSALPIKSSTTFFF